MDLEIIKQNDIPFKLSEFNVVVQDIRIHSIPLTSERYKISGSAGTHSYGSEYEDRKIEVDILFISKDLHDFTLLRDELQEKLVDKDGYYIRELRQFAESDYKVKKSYRPVDIVKDANDRFITGKVYHVEIDGSFNFEQINIYGTSTINFITKDTPFARSVATSQQASAEGLNAESEAWAFGMGLSSESEFRSYTHHALVGKTFSVYNAGTIPEHHPFELDLKMKISNVVGSTEMFQITNKTNGSRARINVPLKSSDVVEYINSEVFKNKLDFIRDTRKDFIWLSPGWNIFEVYYCVSATIEFDFPFYYL